MAIIKRFIQWLINLFKKIFGIGKKNINNTRKHQKINKKNKINSNIISIPNSSLPDYMMLNNSDKEKLIYSITLMMNFLLETKVKEKEVEEKKLLQLLKDRYHINTTEIIDEKYLDSLIKELDNEEKTEVINQYHRIIKREEEFKVHVDEIEKVIKLIKNNDISLVEESEIDTEISNIVNDKNINEDTEKKIDYFNKNVSDIIDNVDEYFLDNVIKEYQKVNYVTVSTMIIDKNYDKFKKLQDDFKNHRYNKHYYEREINKIKRELNQIKNLKNKKEVSEHIEKLRKELYTKSKDKYDLLYNNEAFMNFDKECDMLLGKINAKVIDIKKENKEEQKVEDNKKDKYIENILLRFKDMRLARELILLSQIEDNELINNPDYDFVSAMFNKYNEGINSKFNFERNKEKTEKVILFNEINMAISKINKAPYISVDHINFRMNDLDEAIDVKKQELFNLAKIDKPKEKEENDSKIKVLKYKDK